MVIFLVGMMGSGKSTIGKNLAKSMGYFFIDMDEYIEKTAGMKIIDIFQEKGEEYFRLIESQALNELKTNQNTIIATGGGTPAYFKNMDTMLTYGRVIFLEVEKSILFNRLLKKHDERPLIKGLDKEGLKNRINNLIENRTAIYTRAHHTYTAGNKIDKDVLAIKNLIFSILN